MTRHFSTYLDCIRFLAAMVVFLGHAAGKPWTAGFLWPFGAYGDTCVVVFFVLSGFVIAYVCDAKERDWQVYSANRIARLWSVVLPALLLTVVIDYVGVQVAPQLYLGQPWYGGDHLSLRYLASVFMLQEAWHADLLPGTNKPLWSLSYEAIYYLAIGCLLFARGWARWVSCLLALLLGGPLVAALFPIWGLGYAAYFLCKRRTMPMPVAVVVFLATIGLLALSPTLRHMLPFDWHVLGEPVLSRYIDAVAFFLNLLAAHGLSQRHSIPAALQRSVATVASSTFVLYLFHRPLIQLFSYVGPADASSWGRRLLVIGGTLVVVSVATPVTETLRKFLREKLTAAFLRIRPLPRVAARI